jgi:hypothetical protein
MRIAFKKIDGNRRHRAFDSEHIYNYPSSSWVFDGIERSKIRNYLNKYINNFNEEKTKEYGFNSYTIEFCNKEDEAFFLMLLANGIEI